MPLFLRCAESSLHQDIYAGLHQISILKDDVITVQFGLVGSKQYPPLRRHFV